MTIKRHKILSALIFLLPFIVLAFQPEIGSAASDCGILLPMCFVGTYILTAGVLIIIPFPSGLIWFFGTLTLLVRAYMQPDKRKFKLFYIAWPLGLVITYINASLIFDDAHIVGF